MKTGEETTVEVEEKVEITPEEIAEKLYDKSDKPEEVDTSDEDKSKEDQDNNEEEVTDKSGDDDKGEQEEPQEEKVAEVYELKQAKDSRLGEDAIDNLTEFAKENELSNDLAQGILDREESAVEAFNQRSLDDYQVRADEGLKEIENDAVLGGDKFEESQKIARKVVQDPRFGSEELTQLLGDETRFGDNPVVFRFLHKIGSAMSDDSFHRDGAAPSKAKSPEELMYGSKATK